MRVDFVMVDPQWLRAQRRLGELMNDFYDEYAFVARVERAHTALRAFADQHQGGDNEGAVHLHTYRAWAQHGATIADPWAAQAKGYMEFHVFRRRPAWIRLVASGFDATQGNRPHVSHILGEVDRLLGYKLESAV